MHQRFPFAKRPWYPHMKPADIALWEKYIEKYPNAYDAVAYDYEVGSGPEFDTTVNPATGGSAKALYQSKIDVVGWKNGKMDCIEIKPRADARTIGQVCGYHCLMRRDLGEDAMGDQIIITDELRPDMQFLCRNIGVKIIVV